MGFWDKIKEVFLKQKKEEDKNNFNIIEDNLIYTGNEPNCWACEMPIHETERKRKIGKHKVHKKCFKKLQKIALNGGSPLDFLED